MTFQHAYSFDPFHGYTLPQLLSVEAPAEPADFREFWLRRYRVALAIDPGLRLTRSAYQRDGFTVWDIEYQSSDEFPIRGWLLEPAHTPATQGILVGHGYGGITAPDFPLPIGNATYLVPCFRGLACSARAPISSDPQWHVLHDIQSRDDYLLGGCVADIWTGVSALLSHAPELAGRLGYMGISFGGGIGALALAWERRLQRGHLNVPSFGHQPLRLHLPSTGSAAAVQAFERHHGHVMETLAYYDAATAARHIRQPMHVAAALFDPVVAPPGQFAVFNALVGEKWLFVLSAGHFDHPQRIAEEQRLLHDLKEFFSGHESRIPPLVQPSPGT